MKKRALTLTELMVLIAIIAVLVGLMTSVLCEARKQARKETKMREEVDIRPGLMSIGRVRWMGLRRMFRILTGLSLAFDTEGSGGSNSRFKAPLV